jgi:hypothetical protein
MHERAGMTAREAIDSWVALLPSSSARLVHRAGALACQLASTSVNIINVAVVVVSSPTPSRAAMTGIILSVAV